MPHTDPHTPDDRSPDGRAPHDRTTSDRAASEHAEESRSSGPAALLPLPVTAVTCLEDRAHVERTTVLDLAAGVRRLRLGPVAATAVDRTLHAELTPVPPTPTAAGPGDKPGDGPGSPADPTAAPAQSAPPAHTVLDVRIVRSWTPRAPRPPAEEDSALRHRLHELERERTELEQRGDRLRARLDLLARLATDLLRDIAEGAGAGEPEAPRWARELDRVDGERDTHADLLRSTEARLVVVTEELHAARTALDLAEAEPDALVAWVDLTVDAPVAGPVGLRLTHLTPCALWRPVYRAALDGDTLTLETEATVWQRTGEDWTDVRLTLSTARSAAATEPPGLTEDRLTPRERAAAERRTVDVEWREEAIGDLGEPAAVVGLPGVADGGEARILRSPALVSVPSDGRAHRVPVSSFTTAARRGDVCAPELSPLVTRLARFDNRSGHALLAGPVDLVRGGGFVGRATLDFTAPGAPASLSFGSHDDYRVERHTEESRASTALSGRTVTTRTVRLHLSRFSAPSERDERTVALRERVPVSEISAVRVRVREEECSPAPDGVDADGVVRWDVVLPPGGRRTVTLVYEVSADGKVAGL
ncbi:MULTISPECIES: DUF4139 domain-containing protein [unclassified Streptomyces]|uniref:DUF4139 domain-containing protein n=1 Tax=unclassified Streptomyces TaxID=2593676 RepID=UPI00380FD257